MKNQRRTPRKDASSQRSSVPPGLLKRMQPDAAGIDCGATSHWVAVPEDRDPQPVREFAVVPQPVS